MLFSNKRGVGLAPETLVKLLLLVAFLVIVLSLLFMVRGAFTPKGAKLYSCWLSSSLKASDNPVSGLFPDTCSVRKIDETLDTRGVAKLLRDTWWAYGAGEADYTKSAAGLLHGDIWPAAEFQVSEKISVEDLLEYLLTHRKGVASSREASDYNYLQEGAEGSTVCFDFAVAGDSFSLVEGQDYHLYFADSSGFDKFFRTDKILVMKELKSRSYWDNKNAFYCINPLTGIMETGNILSEANLLGGGWTE